MRILTLLSVMVMFGVTAFAQQNAGTTAQNFSVSTIRDEAIELEKLKGKVVVMTFWSTRCQICAEEIPDLNKLVDKYDAKDVVFLGLAWQDKAKLDVFLKKKPFKFKIVPQSFGVLLKYSDRDSNGRLNMGFPAHFVVDQQGTVVYKAAGFDRTKKLNSTIEGLLRNTGATGSL
ncbi:MAG: TlpA family protein disulfide reductase [Acidobacteriota bacterium]|nr:TlpA family protein disulfide reductase [Acidobacteriota bacterium]MDH3529299.1 TlpA family protein disulfide reductase [Acidobacteriota bacterium]